MSWHGIGVFYATEENELDGDVYWGGKTKERSDTYPLAGTEDEKCDKQTSNSKLNVLFIDQVIQNSGKQDVVNTIGLLDADYIV